MTTPLSPTAQAVLDAFLGAPVDMGSYEMMQRRELARAVAALADQVVPDGPGPSGNSDWYRSKSLDQYDQRQDSRAELLAIATELNPNG